MYSKIFPLLSKGIYLNTAYVGLMSKGLVQFRANNEKDYLSDGYHNHYIIGDAKTTRILTMDIVKDLIKTNSELQAKIDLIKSQIVE